MDVWTMIASSAFGLSFLASALQLGNWALRADPRVIANAGRWTLLGLGVAAAAGLTWLLINRQWTSAMMLAAFVMPVLVQSAPRWRSLLAQLRLRRRNWAGPQLDTSGATAPERRTPSGDPPDPDLVRQSIVVLRAYLDQVRLVDEVQRIVHHQLNGHAVNGRGHNRMSAEEACDVLGLPPGAGVDQIGEAHLRLQKRVDPELGGSYYLTTKINEARDVLLEE
jgi:hypothetical protein